MGQEIVIPEAARAFAQIQIGELNDRNNDPDWDWLANKLAQFRFETIKKHLPARCHTILDIGGGVAISDIPILRHYMSLPELFVLDGDSESATVTSHSEPFNCIAATDALLEANGIKLAGYWTPHAISNWKQWKNKLISKPFDLVVSFAAWGFHFFPDDYLDFVEHNTRTSSKLILDLRINKPEWRENLERNFKLLSIAYSSQKYDRLVYERR